MTTFAPVTNFAYALIDGGITSVATAFSVVSGGSKFPLPSMDGNFNATIWNVTDYEFAHLDPNAEIVTVTGRTTNAFTVTRGAESTSAVAHNTTGKTYAIALTFSKSSYDALTSAINARAETASPTFTGTAVFDGVNIAGSLLFTASGVNVIATNTSDASDSKAITIAGGGAYGPTRGSGIAIIGNEYATIGGDLELMAGDSAISGAIKHYVGNGAGGAYLAVKTDRTTGLTNFYGGIDCLALTQLRYAVTIGGNATADAVGLEIGNTAGGTPYIDFKRSAVDYDVRIINGTATSLSFLGGSSGYYFDSAVALTGNWTIGAIVSSSLIANNTTNGLIIQGAGGTNDMLFVNSAGSSVFRIPGGGSTNVRFYGAIEPTSNDAAAIGSASRSFSDAFLASGGVINWNNGTYTATQNSTLLTFSGSISSIYATVRNTANATLTTSTEGLTIAGNLVTSAYVADGYTPGLVWASTDDNATKPKGGIFLRTTGSGAQMIFGMSSVYATGITNSIIFNESGGIQTTSKIQVGSTAPTQSQGSALTVNSNITTGAAGSGSIIVQGEANKERIKIYSAGGSGGGSPLINLFSFRGTLASPSATQIGDVIAGVSGGGYGATAFSGNQYVFFQQAAENWTDSAMGTYTAFYSVPNGTTGAVARILIANDGTITFGSAFNIGTGALYAGTAVFTTASTSLTGISLTHSGVIAGGQDGVLINCTGANTNANSSALYVLQSNASSTQITARFTNLGSSHAVSLISAGGATLLSTQNTVTSTNFVKHFQWTKVGGGVVTLWISNGTDPNGVLSGTAGDVCFNCNSSLIKKCTGTTNWS